jgi:hypothetical protein
MVDPVLDPERLSKLTEDSARALIPQGQSANTQASYPAAMRYWSAWYGARYDQALQLPVAVPMVVQFIVDHAERVVSAKEEGDPEEGGQGKSAREDGTQEEGGPQRNEGPTNEDAEKPRKPSRLAFDLPPAVDAALVAAGYKGKLGADSLATLIRRISVQSKAHQNLKVANPCHHPQVVVPGFLLLEAYPVRADVDRRRRGALLFCDGASRAGHRDDHRSVPAPDSGHIAAWSRRQ